MDKKNIEAQHYDQKAENEALEELKKDFSLSRGDRILRKAHYCYIQNIKKNIPAISSGIFLDYGCGTGVKHHEFAKTSNRIIGIDVSSKSVEIGNIIAKEKNLNAEYLVMDCEKMIFSDNYFDAIFDYGTFSSLDTTKAFPELIRVMKPEAVMIAIETFGHNPVTNLKRWFNVVRGKRTRWAASHIMKKNDWQKLSSKFQYSEFYYFGFFVIFLGPLARFCPDFILKIFEAADHLFFKIKAFRKYAFKSVVVLKNPIKNNP
jgi:ubiquinone/menaquinone biosynthesis C-methylase UbiE